MIKEWNEKTIERLQKEGRGEGVGASYRPWIQHGDFSSDGNASSVRGLKIPRTHFVLSKPEHAFLLCAEWSPQVIDIREQYPLPREFTRAIADQLKVRHPYYPGTHVPTVMTTDFLLTMERPDGELYQLAVDVKTAGGVEDATTLDKLEIVRTYFEGLGIGHKLVLDTSIPTSVCRNLDTMRSKLPREKEFEEDLELLESLKAPMTSWTRGIGGADRELSASMICAKFDEHYGQKLGTGLRVLAMLFNDRTLPVNLHVKSIFNSPWHQLVDTAWSKAVSQVLRAA